MKKENKKHRRSYLRVTTLAPLIQKDIHRIILFRMKQKVEFMVSCEELLKAKTHTIVYTKECEEDEESVDFLYHITALREIDASSQVKVDGGLEYIAWCYYVSLSKNDPQEEEDPGDAPPELEQGVKATINPLKEVNKE